MQRAIPVMLLTLLASCASRVVATIDGSAPENTPLVLDGAIGDRLQVDLRPGRCYSNADCTGSKFCHFASGCGAAGPGVCKDAPGGCTADCPGVCGCDGKTYCNACSAFKAGTSTDPSGASCPTTCSDLNQAYMDTVQQARTCCPACGTTPQCGEKVWNALPTGCPCPCETFIQSTTATLQKLKTLEQQWVNRGCGVGLPPPPDQICCDLYPACQPVKSGICSAQGMCQDQVCPLP